MALPLGPGVSLLAGSLGQSLMFAQHYVAGRGPAGLEGASELPLSYLVSSHGATMAKGSLPLKLCAARCPLVC